MTITNKNPSSQNDFALFARAILFNQQGEVLLIRKNMMQKIIPGKWLFPGGKAEWGEEIEETLKRELKEELGAEITSLKLIGTRTLLVDDTHWQGLYYKVAVKRLDSITNNEPDKHSAIGWFSVSKLPSDMDEIDRRHIELAKKL